MSIIMDEPRPAPVPLTEDLMEVLYQAQHQLGQACLDRPCECHLMVVSDRAVLDDDPGGWCEPCQLRWARLQVVRYALRHHAGKIRNLTTAVETATDLEQFFEDRRERLRSVAAPVLVRA